MTEDLDWAPGKGGGGGGEGIEGAEGTAGGDGLGWKIGLGVGSLLAENRDAREVAGLEEDTVLEGSGGGIDCCPESWLPCCNYKKIKDLS